LLGSSQPRDRVQNAPETNNAKSKIRKAFSGTQTFSASRENPPFFRNRRRLELEALPASVASTDDDKKYSPQAARKFPLGESIARGTFGLEPKAC
jgi:hypothetical protein